MASTPLSLTAYRCATRLLQPAVPALLRRRARRGKEDPARLSERLGQASQPRPDGTLIWIHGASIGESLAALPLIAALLATPGRYVLMTSGTVASARMMKDRLPARALHQFSPVDAPDAVARFLDHWRPDIALFVDSEIWPNLLVAAQARGVPLMLVNGRMSERSFRGWQRAPRMAAGLLSLYDVCLAQDEATAARLTALGARDVAVSGSLKADADVLAADPEKLEALCAAIGTRPVFLASSTHPGEDEILLRAHDMLRRDFPALLTIIVPRHAARGAEIAALCGARSAARRSLHQAVAADTDIYIADTMGELGLFYRLAPFAFIGKSLAAQGGQNPLEAARLSCAVLAGPHTEAFADAYDAIFRAQGTGRIADADDLVRTVRDLLQAPQKARALGEAAKEAAQSLSGALERTRLAVERLLLAHARA